MEVALTVNQILDQKGSSEVLTVSPQETIAAAAKILAEKGIGALIVSDGADGVAGILSERDIVGALAREGGGCLNGAVSGLMTVEVKSCAPEDTAVSVLTRMTQGRFRHMPVVRDGALVGVISIGDVVKARMSEIEMENTALEDMIRGV